MNHAKSAPVLSELHEKEFSAFSLRGFLDNVASLSQYNVSQINWLVMAI